MMSTLQKEGKSVLMAAVRSGDVGMAEAAAAGGAVEWNVVVPYHNSRAESPLTVAIKSHDRAMIDLGVRFAAGLRLPDNDAMGWFATGCHVRTRSAL